MSIYFKVDPDFQKTARFQSGGRNSGRTAAMLLNAIDLAKEPHSILTLWPSRNIAEWGFHQMLALLEANPDLVPQPWEVKYRANEAPRQWIDFANGAEVRFLPITSAPGRWMAICDTMSILYDHTVDDFAHSQRGEQFGIRHWEEAKRIIETRATALRAKPY